MSEYRAGMQRGFDGTMYYPLSRINGLIVDDVLSNI